MSQIKKTNSNKVTLDKSYLEDLKLKASFFEDILSIIEDRYLGHLIQKTEKEKNIPLSVARKLLS